MPQKELLQSKNFVSFLIHKKARATRKGINKPKGPLVKTASPEKVKNSKIPAAFFSFWQYPQKNEAKEIKINMEKIISVNTVLAKPI